MISNHARCGIFTLCLAILPVAGFAYQVLPKISDVDRNLVGLSAYDTTNKFGQWAVSSALPMLKNPVHEAITLNALGCEVSAGNEISCVTPDRIIDNQVILYGARWPDDPPFALSKTSPPKIQQCDPNVTLRSTSQPLCWYNLFNDASKKALALSVSKPNEPAFGPGTYLLYRSHFGDLQFFHSMAAYNGETAASTVARMKMWAQFLWGIADNSLSTGEPIRSLEVENLDQYFPGDMNAKNLFATGIVSVRKQLDEVAIGAMLHMVQDSFSQAHTGRNWENSGGQCKGIPRFEQPGKIQQFYSYAGQISSKHDHEDTFNALSLQTIQQTPNVVDVSRGFLALWKERMPWSEAEKYFNCVFALEDPQAKAGPGLFTKDH